MYGLLLITYPERKGYAVGGGVSSSLNGVSHNTFVELRDARSYVEAEIIAIKQLLQFVIQEVHVSESEIMLMSGSSTLAAWMNKQGLTKWDLRFEGNLFFNIKEWLQKVQFCLLVRSRNPWKENWKKLVESTFRGDQS